MLAALSLASAAALALAASAAPVRAEATFPSDIRVLKIVRVVTGDDGRSHFASDVLVAGAKDYMQTGKPFQQIDFGAAVAIRLVKGPANVTFPLHASIGREMFLALQGTSFVTLPDGTERSIEAGTLVVMDDMGSTTGHGGRTGLGGYVALQIIPAPPVPVAANLRKE